MRSSNQRMRKLEQASILIMSLIMSALLLPFAAAESQDVGEMTKAEAKALYYRAVAGDEKARKQSTAEFRKLANFTPEDPEVMAYQGSLQLLEAGKTWAMWRKYELSKQGIVLLDGAVERAPENLEVRFVRAATTRKLPPFFKRAGQSKDDLTFLADRVPAAAHRGQLDPALASAALYFYATDVATGEQKTKALQLAVKLAPTSKAGVEAAKSLSLPAM